MKIITFVVPCYNSAAYMEKCIETLLPAGEDAEIILVNDGSTDGTAVICDQYAEKYPNIIKAIHQENGGHGEGVNQGIRNAKGLYFKVVDSDDWLDVDAMQKLLAQLRTFSQSEKPIDLVICNYVYEHTIDNTSTPMRYTNVLPQNTVFTWQDCKIFRVTQYILMHSVIYRTELLRESETVLPKHTFYVDNLFVYNPFPFVKTIYYMNLDLYRYFIGRADQSVNESIMIKRVAQQIKVTRLMLHSHDLQQIRKSQPKLANYMTNYLSMMFSISSILLLLDNTSQSNRIHDELWKDLQNYDAKLYRRIRYASIAFFPSFNGKVGRGLAIKAYRTARRFYHFN